MRLARARCTARRTPGPGRGPQSGVHGGELHECERDAERVVAALVERQAPPPAAAPRQPGRPRTSRREPARAGRARARCRCPRLVASSSARSSSGPPLDVALEHREPAGDLHAQPRGHGRARARGPAAGRPTAGPRRSGSPSPSSAAGGRRSTSPSGTCSVERTQASSAVRRLSWSVRSRRNQSTSCGAVHLPRGAAPPGPRK